MLRVLPAGLSTGGGPKHYPEPATWLSARLNFTRTYAVWCMVGHAVGLGDRHLGKRSLGHVQRRRHPRSTLAAFSTRGSPPTRKPEVVPFRLTQNIIDAFGFAGVDGVYRNSFETTLLILRKHAGSMLSVMEGFVHDPLVDWAKNEPRRTSSGDKEASNAQARDWLATISGRVKGHSSRRKLRAYHAPECPRQTPAPDPRGGPTPIDLHRCTSGGKAGTNPRPGPVKRHPGPRLPCPGTRH